ncbi:hypothetical protein C8R43DRAFT_1212234 [Mycena crocata]|nr:hypothetical protein C8R43DRAFT_1212234 [Mycena crocata]
MSASIIGTLPISHSVDANGSLAIEVSLQIPPAKVAPKFTLAYHSASTGASAAGMGWALKGAPSIQRVAATQAQDGFHGVVNYNENDRFSLDGQRLVHIGGNEYHYEIEQWSKFVVEGNPRNPTSWTEYLPDGGIRSFGTSPDSNIKASGQNATRVWALSHQSDAFFNYMSFKYSNDHSNGTYYLAEASYGGNQTLNMAHQRKLQFEYETRPDISTTYLGGSVIRMDKRLESISSFVHNNLVNKHFLEYDTAPLTGVSRVVKISLADAKGAIVRPLIFDWVNGNPTIFDSPGPTTSVNFVGTEVSMMPMDVLATGRSDIVVVSKHRVSNKYQTRIATHLSNASGVVSAIPTFINEQLPYHAFIFPVDVNGDGRTDLIHISLATTTREFTITVLLSTVNGFQAQKSVKFKPVSTAGTFRCGDFEGNGHLGMLYVYQKNTTNLEFVQFLSNGNKFTERPPSAGPSNVSFQTLRMVIGDLDGNGAEDVFLLSPKTEANRKYCHISLLQSNNGTLEFHPREDLVLAGKSIGWSDTTSCLPYSLDEDGKTSLLFPAKRTQTGKLVLQVLRSTGQTLLPSPSPIETMIPYDGNLTLARTSSTSSLDLINTFNMPNANPPRTDVRVLRFRDGAFQPVGTVRQGPSFASPAKWGDFRGIGRSDMLLNTQHATTFDICTMPCASSQPVDFLAGYTNGMDARVAVLYAPLTDRTVYDVDDNFSNFPLAASNAMARNVSSTAHLSTSSVSEASHSRCQLVYFPSWVVKQVVGTPYSARPTVQEQNDYTYRNALFSFDGHGWLGFQTMTKSAKVLGTLESTWYLQKFPFLGQVDRTETKTTAGHLLGSRHYTWNSISPTADHSHSIQMSSYSQTYHEGGTLAYTVNAGYYYDAYGNLTEVNIVSPEIGTPALSIISSFKNSTGAVWVIGNKTSEVVKQSGLLMKETRITYFFGTQLPERTENWVKADEWSTQTVQIDATGNQMVVRGPAGAHNEFKYDATYSHAILSTTFVSDYAAPLTETTHFALEYGKPLSYTDPNGSTVSFVYDVLGRALETYQHDVTSGKTLVKTESFRFERGQFKRVAKSRTVWGEDKWLQTVECLDGAGQVWRSERPKPDGSLPLIYNDMEYDGAGRITASSRDYFAGSSPEFTTYKYDARSRTLEETAPPPSSNLPATTITSAYKFSSGLAECIETSSAGNVSKSVSRKTRYLPNADNPSVDNLMKPFVVISCDELSQQVETTFDGLGRPTCVKDPGGVHLTLSWDGLSRLVERRIFQSPCDINHSAFLYDDVRHTTTVRNVLTGELTITSYDLCKRPISMSSPDEKLAYTYDTGGQFSKGRLMSVVSETTGLARNYDYDIYGQLVSDVLLLDGETYRTAYHWSPLRQLLGVTNPDGTTITRSLCADGQSVSHLALTDAEAIVQATVSLSRYDDVFGRPLLCEFGNGVSSLSALHSNGALASTTLSNNGQTLQQQDWKFDAFHRINEYERNCQGDMHGSTKFLFDASGQVTQSMSGDPRALDATPEQYLYDISGNLSGKDGKTFLNHGWQLSSVESSNGNTECLFKYSADGNMLAQTDDTGTVLKSMEYDSQSRLINADRARMMYDFGGRLVKCTHANGDVTIYPSQSYEVDIAAGEETHTSYLVHGYRRASLSGNIAQYYHTDHLGSTIGVSDESGSLVTQYKYDTFGVVSIEGEDLSRYKFSGKELIGDIYYFGARFYDPAIGRFLTLDNYPIDLDDISPCTFNMYTFAQNNPVNFVDINGNAPWWHWRVVLRGFVDAVLIVAGAALHFVPGMSVVAGAVLGAGLSGLMADIHGASDAEWGIQIGLGAAFGAIGGAAGAAVDLALPAASAATKFAVNFAVGEVIGVGAKVADNAIHGRRLDAALMPAGINFLATGKMDWEAMAKLLVSEGIGAASAKYKGSKRGDYNMGRKGPGSSPDSGVAGSGLPGNYSRSSGSNNGSQKFNTGSPVQRSPVTRFPQTQTDLSMSRLGSQGTTKVKLLRITQTSML